MTPTSSPTKISKFSKLCAKYRPKNDVLLIGGNHGRKLDVLAEDLDIKIRDEYAFTLGKNRFLCLHGDEFDLFVKHFPMTSNMFGRLYYLIQKLSTKKQKGPVMVKMIMKKSSACRAGKSVWRSSTARRGAQVVICSHTHIPHMETKNGILFINSGSFCDNPSNYVAISPTGETELVGV